MSDAARPLPLRMRPDLVISHETFGARRYVIVKDPLALRHYRFQAEEFAQLELLNGRRTLEEMRTELERRFAPQQFSVEEISRFAATLHTAALVTSDTPGQGNFLSDRSKKRTKRAWLQRLASPLSLRLRGVDPTRVLDALSPLVRWCFTRTALVFAALLALTALLLVTVHYEEFQRRLPSYQQFFTPGNMFLLLAVTGGIKVLHEFGHGLTCRRFGGECHEMGLMFLVFAPCLYCNVSDAWRLPKRQRIAVSAAGIVVEIVLASLATFGWWFSAPGLWNQLCLGTMFVSGVSTILINGNPLLRYDGYFILSDFVETPNLAEKSAAVMRHAAGKVWFGEQTETDPLLPQRGHGWFAFYAVASFCYRVALIGTIFFYLLDWLQPYRLGNIARFFGLLSIGGLIGGIMWRFLHVLKGLPERVSSQQRRFGICTAATLAFVGITLFVPLPQRVWGTFELEPHDPQQVYVEVPGRIVNVAVRPGQNVAPGTVLATLENLELEREIVELNGRADVLRSELAALRLERYQSSSAGERISEVEENLRSVQATLVEKEAERQSLRLTATRAGVVLPPPETPAVPQESAAELPTWHGRPGDVKNLGATLEEGTIFCRIGDRAQWESLVAVDQGDVELLVEGQTVELQVTALPDRVFRGRVAEVSRRELNESPGRLSNKSGGDLATETGIDGVERPISATYQARIVLEDSSGELRIGLRGTARIHVPPASLGSRTRRWFNRTFHFDL